MAEATALLDIARRFTDMPALAPPDVLMMDETTHDNVLICQPQHRNTAGRVFGGFLLRRGFELAYSSAYLFAGAAPKFVSCERVDFLLPVEVGSLLSLKSTVVHACTSGDMPRIYVEVVASVMKPESRESAVSNDFVFTFTCAEDAQLRRVLPGSDRQALAQARVRKLGAQGRENGSGSGSGGGGV